MACTRAPAAQDPERVALETAIRGWVTAVNGQDERTLTTMMTYDVELLDGNAAVKGREAAVRALAEVAARGQLSATSRELTSTNDLAWHVVAYTQAGKNGVLHARGDSLEIWKRVKGEWKLHRQMAAELLSPTVELTRPSTSEPVLDRPVN